MYVGSLFSGIRGFELGFSREGFETKWFVEDNSYCQAVLKKNFPNIPIYGNIREIDFWKLERVNILTGGFPCQDISCANPRGEGISGERSGLWSYYAEAIREIRPKYAIIENVPMLANKGLNIVLRDLAENGYDAEWFCLRASDFGALHRRERLFVIAYPNNSRNTTSRCNDNNMWEENMQGRESQFKSDGQVNTSNINEQLRNKVHRQQPNDEGGVTSNPNHQRQPQLQRGKQDIRGRDNNGIETLTHSSNSNKGQHKDENQEVCSRRDSLTSCFITNDWDERIQRFCEESLQGQQGFSWCQDVRRIDDLQKRPDIPEPLFRGGRDGLPNWMDRIKCCGNAVVPQVAHFIARRIKEIERVK